MRYSRSAAIGTAAASLLTLHVASAAPNQTKLSITGCGAANVSADRLFEMARAELAPRVLTPSDETLDPTATQLRVTLCHGAASRVMLQLFDHGELRISRHVDLSDVAGELRTRTLAVALAELIAATPEHELPASDSSSGAAPAAAAASGTDSRPTSRTEVPAPQHARVAPAPTTSESELRRQVHAAPAVRLSMGAALREFFGPPTTLTGPWLGFSWNGVGGQAQLLVNRQQTPLGSIALYDANLAGSYRIFSLGSGLVTSANLCAEFGQIWARGKATANTRVAESAERVTHFALAIDVGLEATLQKHLAIELHLQTGAARGVAARVDGGTIANTQGAFIGANLGLSVIGPGV